MFPRSRVLPFAILLWLCALAAPAATFTFDTIAIDTAVPFSDTQEGLKASFSSPSGDAFWVEPTFFATLSGNVLLNVYGMADRLDVEFGSSTVSGVAFRFALNTIYDSDTITVQAFQGGLGGALVGSATVAGNPPPGGLGTGVPEGEIRLSPAVPFDAISITSTAPWGFAIDDLTVVPEPAGSALLAAGLGVLAWLRRRRETRLRRL